MVDVPVTEVELSKAPGMEEIARELPGADLSTSFGPFLPTFLRQALRLAGEVWTTREAGVLTGLLLTDPSERVASVFTRSPTVAAGLVGAAPRGTAVYGEVDFGGVRERYFVHAAELGAVPEHRFRHALRLLQREDDRRVDELLVEVYGMSSARWLTVAREVGERGVGVEVDGELAGVGWVLTVGPRARLHGLTVRPGRRRAGIALDLVFARLLLARRAGAEQAISEIAERNLPSRALAERAGMSASTPLYLYPPADGPTLAPGGT